jgi:vacuolar-type H+-ATPase subunit I/STV1
VDISAVNDGLFFVTAEDGGAGLERYGRISAVEIFDEITDPVALKSYAQASINSKSSVTTSYRISALDLATIGLEIEEFQLGGLCQLINPIMEIDREIRVIKLTVDLNSPQKSSIEVGQIIQSISSLTASAKDLANTVNGLTARLPEIQQQTLEQANQNTQAAIEELGEVITAEELTQLLQLYVSLSYLQNNYSTTSAVNALLEDLATKNYVGNLLENYVQKDSEIEGEKITGNINIADISAENINLNGENLTEKLADINTKIADLESKITFLVPPESEENNGE